MSSLRGININYCESYNSDDITNIKDLDLDKIQFTKDHVKIFYFIFLFYCIVYKTSYNQKPLCISFNRIDEYIKRFGRQKYVALYPPDEKCERMFAKIQYPIS